MRISPRVLATCLSLSIGFGGLALPAAALAAPPSEATEAKLAEAQELYQAGKASFDTADYDEALSKWKKAYGLLTESQDTHEIRNALVYNISEAEIKSYEVNRDPAHLRKAKVLLTDYVRNHESLYGEERAEERQQAKDRLVEVDAMLETSAALGESGGGTEVKTPEGPAEVAAPAALSAKEREKLARIERRNEIAATPELTAQGKQHQKKVVTGAVLIGVGGGVALVGLVVIGASPRINPVTFEASLSGPVLATGLILGVAGLATAIAGAVILPKGLRGRKELQTPRPHNYAAVDGSAAAAAGGGTAPAADESGTDDAATDEAAPVEEPAAEPTEATAVDTQARLDLRPRFMMAPYADKTGGGVGMMVRF